MPTTMMIHGVTRIEAESNSSEYDNGDGSINWVTLYFFKQKGEWPPLLNLTVFVSNPVEGARIARAINEVYAESDAPSVAA